MKGSMSSSFIAERLVAELTAELVFGLQTAMGVKFLA